MKIYTETSLSDFEAWSGAEDTLETLREKGLCDDLEQILESEYPDGMEDSELNDFLWFEEDTIAQMLGFSSWEALENDGESEEEEENDEEQEEFDEFCGRFACTECPYQHCVSMDECAKMWKEDKAKKSARLEVLKKEFSKLNETFSELCEAIRTENPDLSFGNLEAKRDALWSECFADDYERITEEIEELEEFLGI